MRKFSYLTLILSCLFLACMAASAQTAPPVADTYSYSASPTKNFGTQQELLVQHQSNSFIRFNLSGVPANTSVSKAVLRLFVDAVGTAGSFDVFAVDSAWSEQSLTWKAQPSIGPSATDGARIAVNTSSKGQFIMVDVTGLVQSWISGAVANNGLALELTSSAGLFSFDSKEAEQTSHEPELLIMPSGPVGPQGAQGPIGPQGPAGPTGTFQTQNYNNGGTPVSAFMQVEQVYGCPDPKYPTLISGGYKTTAVADPNATIFESFADGTTWRVGLYNDGPNSYTFTIYIVCGGIQ